MSASFGPLTNCPKCWYDLTGLPKTHRCPECGFEYADSAQCWFYVACPRYVAYVLYLGVALIWSGAFVELISYTHRFTWETMFNAFQLVVATIAGYVIYLYRRVRNFVMTDQRGFVWRQSFGKELRFDWTEFKEWHPGTGTLTLYCPHEAVAWIESVQLPIQRLSPAARMGLVEDITKHCENQAIRFVARAG